MRLRLTAISLLLAAAAVYAQETPKMEVRGTLSEIGLGTGIAGAQITVSEFSKDSARSTFATGVTDGQGSFAFYFDRPGNYYFEVKKAGYFGGDAATAQADELSAKATKREAEGPAEATGALATLSKDHPREFLRFALMRHAELRGRVVDEQDNPLKGRVELLEPGARSALLATATAPDGTFRIRQVRPG